MNVGLPGTGLGGIFYLISAFGLLMRELVELLRGRSNSSRLRFALLHGGMALAMVLSVIATLWLVFRTDVVLTSLGHGVQSRFVTSRQAKPIFITAFILVLLLGGIRVANFVLQRKIISKVYSPERKVKNFLRDIL